MSGSEPRPDEPVGGVRDLHFFWVVDYSGSMSGKKIATVNSAIRDVLPEIRKAVAANYQIRCLMRAIRFSDDAEWHVGPQEVPVEQFAWPDLTTLGGTATAKAIRLLASELTTDKLRRRGVPPVCILVSDGFCTDAEGEYDEAIKSLVALPWGKQAVRLSLGIGEAEADYDEQELLKFVSHREIGVLKARNPAELIKHIKWASLSAVKSIVGGKSKMAENGGIAHVSLPLPPPDEPSLSDASEGFEL